MQILTLPLLVVGGISAFALDFWLYGGRWTKEIALVLTFAGGSYAVWLDSQEDRHDS